MKLAFVIPRYGVEVVGGAELGARMLAERIAEMPGWEVEVFTTCASDHVTWEDDYAEGDCSVNGVTVHRFSPATGRDPGFAPYSQGVLAAPSRATPEESREWIRRQGPVCPALVDAAAGSEADVVSFYPYLYYPTVFGVERVGQRAIMQPAAHDEAPLRLPIFEEVFRDCSGFAFHTYGERRLVNSRFRVAHKPQVVAGLGVDEAEADVAEASAAVGFDVTDRPYLCCVGRVEPMKGSDLVAELFLKYKQWNPGPLSLVYAGAVIGDAPTGEGIVVTGRVSEAAKWGLLSHAEALVCGSPYESFSLVLLEAWLAGIPVVVNGACEATVEHCRRSGGGLVFGGPVSQGEFDEFQRALDAVCSPRAAELATAGRAYVDREFRWPAVLDRYCSFVSSMAERASGRIAGSTYAGFSARTAVR